MAKENASFSRRDELEYLIPWADFTVRVKSADICSNPASEEV